MPRTCAQGLSSAMMHSFSVRYLGCTMWITATNVSAPPLFASKSGVRRMRTTETTLKMAVLQFFCRICLVVFHFRTRYDRHVHSANHCRMEHISRMQQEPSTSNIPISTEQPPVDISDESAEANVVGGSLDLPHATSGISLNFTTCKQTNSLF